MSNPGFVFKSQSGCLLPILIIFNFFFGKLIFGSTRLWLGIEGILILIFMININIMARKISRNLRDLGQGFSTDTKSYSSKGKVIDIQGQVIQDEKKLE